GCSDDSTGEATGAANATAGASFELKSSNDETSIQSELYALLSAFKGDAAFGIKDESPSFEIVGGQEPHAPKRSLTCSEATLVHGQLGGSVTNTKSHACALEGFNPTRDGVQLPNVSLPVGDAVTQSTEPLAGKLANLLSKGEAMGGFGIQKS